MDVIEGLLRIKRIREAGRERELRRARGELEDAVRAAREAQERQDQHERERAEHEAALYRDLMTRLVRVRDLDDLHGEVDAMKKAAIEDAEAVEQARAEREQRRQAENEAQSAWRLASRACDKFEDLRRQHQLERLLQEERVADLELEEHPPRARDRFPDEAAHEDAS